MKKNEPLIIVEVSLDASRERVWRAITERDQMTQWFFNNIPDFKAEVHFETQFPVKSEDRTFTHLWKVTEVIPHQKISYSWKYEEYPGNSISTFELAEEEGQVRLRLICEVIEDFQDGIPEFTRESCIGGWEYFLGKNLKAYLG